LYKDELIIKSQLDSLEAGFEAIVAGYLLSSTFLFLAVLFVLFDLELLLLIPVLMIIMGITMLNIVLWAVLILFILVTLLLE